MGRLALVLAALSLTLAPVVQADTITNNVASYITSNSVLPLGTGVALELADNLMTAQADSSYAASEPDSLTLSVASVLRAIWIEDYPGGPPMIDNALDAPIPFAQSMIAIDDRAAVTITVNGVLYQPGDVIDFGQVVIPTPEPSTALLVFSGIDLMLIGWWIKRRKEGGQ